MTQTPVIPFVVLCCGDWRLHSPKANGLLSQALEQIAQQRDCSSTAGPGFDLLARPSPVRALAQSSSAPGPASQIVQDVQQFCRLHGPSIVVLATHSDCGAYGGRSAFADEDQQQQVLIQDLERAQATLNRHLPRLATEFLFMHTNSQDVSHVEWLTGPRVAT